MANSDITNICPNLLYTTKGLPLNNQGVYNGASCYLICGGPSLEKMDLSKLQQRGVIIAAVNNVAATHVRPNIWFSVDHPKSYCDNIWRDPFVSKYIKEENVSKALFDRDERGRLKHANAFVYQMPNVFYYRGNEDFVPKEFLVSPTVNWGMHSRLTDSSGNKGGRSVMYPALRILFYLGIRTVYLLGADFHMEESRPYVFEQKKWSGGCHTNNDNYRMMGDRFTQLLPYFEKYNYRVLNCTPDSHLKTFPYKDFDISLSEVALKKLAITKDMYGGST